MVISFNSTRTLIKKAIAEKNKDPTIDLKIQISEKSVILVKEVLENFTNRLVKESCNYADKRLLPRHIAHIVNDRSKTHTLLPLIQSGRYGVEQSAKKG